MHHPRERTVARRARLHPAGRPARRHPARYSTARRTPRLYRRDAGDARRRHRSEHRGVQHRARRPAGAPPRGRRRAPGMARRRGQRIPVVRVDPELLLVGGAEPDVRDDRRPPQPVVHPDRRRPAGAAAGIAGARRFFRRPGNPAAARPNDSRGRDRTWRAASGGDRPADGVASGAGCSSASWRLPSSC